MNDTAALKAIEHQLLATDKAQPLAKEQVEEWAASADIEVLGAVFQLMHDPEQYTRIEQPFTLEDYRKFHLKYYERCLKENPDGTWCDSRYLAAHSLTNWFLGIWQDKNVPKASCEELKSLLSRLFKEGDEKLRTAIITGILEHLFSDEEIREFFRDWQSDPELSDAYTEALSFSGTGRN